MGVLFLRLLCRGFGCYAALGSPGRSSERFLLIFRRSAGFHLSVAAWLYFISFLNPCKTESVDVVGLMNSETKIFRAL